MRYPDTTFMKRTFDLARNRLGLTAKMLPYIRANENAFLSYNGISVTKKKNAETPPADDIFRVSVQNDGNVPNEFVKEGTGAFWTEALGPLRDLFVKYPFPEAFKRLKELDRHSVMSYLTFEKNYPYHVIKWFETMESRTGLNDEALSETVLASLVFNDPRFADKKIDWFCFECAKLLSLSILALIIFCFQWRF